MVEASNPSQYLLSCAWRDQLNPADSFRKVLTRRSSFLSFWCPCSFFHLWPLLPPTPRCVFREDLCLKALCVVAEPRFHHQLEFSPLWGRTQVEHRLITTTWSWDISSQLFRVSGRARVGKTSDLHKSWNPADENPMFQDESGRGYWHTRENSGSGWRRWSSSLPGESDPMMITKGGLSNFLVRWFKSYNNKRAV